MKMKLTTSSKIVATVCAIIILQPGPLAHSAENIPGVAEQPAAYFYTGKPYDSDLGSYTFAYRNYNPEINRWTSADPSGFPDGANHSIYTTTPTTLLDPDGLMLNFASAPNGASYYAAALTDIMAWNAGRDFAGALQTAAMDHAESGTNWTLNASEISAVRGTSIYSTFRNDVQTAVDVSYTGAPTGSAQYNFSERNYTFTHGSDAYYEFGDARLGATGTVVTSNSGWDYYADVTLSDVFDFSGYAGVPWYTPTGVGYRLQTNGWISAFDTSGTWQETWSE